VQRPAAQPQISSNIEVGSTAALTENDGLGHFNPQDETVIRGNPKIAFICQFLGIFRNVMKIQVSKNFITEEILEAQQAANLKSDNIYNQPSGATATVQKVDKPIAPFDLENSILRPQIDPLVGDIVTRLLQKNKWKLKENESKFNKDDDEKVVQS